MSYAAIFALTPALADLDGDGDLDLAVGGPGSITTLLADGTGGLAAPQLTPISASLDYITTADVDEDGIPAARARRRSVRSPFEARPKPLPHDRAAPSPGGSAGRGRRTW